VADCTGIIGTAIEYSNKLYPTCTEHTGYRAINPPVVPCEQCRYLWDNLGKDRIHETGKSGALSSGHVPAMWQVPLSLTLSCARRMTKGNDKGYSIHNWRKGLGDVNFIRDRANHALQHLIMLMNGDMTIDDAQGNSDGLSWFVAMINEALRLHPEAVAAAFYSESRDEKVEVKK